MEWKKIRRASGLIEYVCKCGVGHPAHYSAKRIAEIYGHSTETWLTHGCCGCCQTKDFPGGKRR